MDDLARQTSKEEKRAMKDIKTYNSEAEDAKDNQVVLEENVQEMLGNE